MNPVPAVAIAFQFRQLSDKPDKTPEAIAPEITVRPGTYRMNSVPVAIALPKLSVPTLIGQPGIQPDRRSLLPNCQFRQLSDKPDNPTNPPPSNPTPPIPTKPLPTESSFHGTESAETLQNREAPKFNKISRMLYRLVRV
ncbi:MAG: hypothetical protein ACRCU2_18170 [Planktothrix sp.]